MQGHHSLTKNNDGLSTIQSKRLQFVNDNTVWMAVIRQGSDDMSRLHWALTFNPSASKIWNWKLLGKVRRLPAALGYWIWKREPSGNISRTNCRSQETAWLVVLDSDSEVRLGEYLQITSRLFLVKNQHSIGLDWARSLETLLLNTDAIHVFVWLRPRVDSLDNDHFFWTQFGVYFRGDLE